MCGIIGYIGRKKAVPILIEGLKRLEYRGYDSAGICILNENRLKVKKKKGKIAELEKEVNTDDFNGNIGIAHTRWATHGEPNEINAHPHFDCSKKISVVHNGIIENYHVLKELLEKDGHKIISDTDSEVLPHLIEKFYTNDLEKAVIEALKCVEGTFGIAVMHQDNSSIIAAKRGSSLIIGIGNDEMFIASDVTAMLNNTKNVMYLNDNEIAVLSDRNYSIKDFEGVEIDREVNKIKWTADQIEKGGFKHFMLKEIFEQPKAVENTLRGRIKNNKVKLSVDIDINSINRIIITACGTSWHSALIGKYIIEKHVGIPVEVDYASEFRYRNPIIKKNDLAIVISQSGETADTLAALREARSLKAKTLGIVNTVGSSITREVDSGIYLHAGPEIGVASTKAFTCQVVSLLLLSLFMRQQRGLKNDKHIFNELEILPEKIEKVTERSEDIRELAENYVGSRDFLYLGRGMNFPVALEGALKLKEISYIHAEGYPAAEMKHGPIALIDKDMPVIFICPKDNRYEKILSNMEEVKARNGKIIAVVDEDDDKINNLAVSILKVPKVIDELLPVVNVIPLQLFAYHIADLRGIDVDKPRNLAKSVTVE